MICIIQIESQNQTINSEKVVIFKNYFSSLKIGSMLNKAGITKTKGASPLKLLTIVFNLAFLSQLHYLCSWCVYPFILLFKNA